MSFAGGEGKEGEGLEETEPHLWVLEIGVGTACGGVPTEEQRPRRVGGAPAALRWKRAAEVEPWSFMGQWMTYSVG